MFAIGCWYCIADYVPSRTGRDSAPALPEGAGYVLLAGPIDTQRWGIFACSGPVEFSDHVRPVPSAIEAILDSGRRYPPALALARDEADSFTEGINQEEYSRRFAERVAHHLQRQAAAVYQLAPAVVDDPGYASKGQYYWVLQYLSESSEVRWVSDDYQVYRNSASDFHLSEDQLGALAKADLAV
jgi:hypothetical protein